MTDEPNGTVASVENESTQAGRRHEGNQWESPSPADGEDQMDDVTAAGASSSAVPTAAVRAAMDALKLPAGYLAAMDAATRLPAGYLAAMDAATKLPAGYEAAMDAATRLPAGYLAAMDAATLSTSYLSGLAGMEIPQSLLTEMARTKRLEIREQPVLRDWAEAQVRTLGPATTPKPRSRRTAVEFFEAFEAEVHSVSELLRALAVMQQRNSHLGLVWRGQQNADWAVDSSLTRRLRGDGHELGEAQMIAVERFQMIAADRWAIPHAHGDLNFLAELQHEGVPTRLVDVSLDPEVAVWFAVQESEEPGNPDARLLAWGRSAAPSRNSQVEKPPIVPAAGGPAFWQIWADKDDRLTNEWGTGRAVPSWQPAALNERMRAQRAAFLFDAEPIIGAELLDMFNEKLEGDWKASEIAEATRIVGFPSPHDKRAKPNRARIVPMFSIRIMADAKSEIRTYLESKGLAEETIYPDRAGLVSYLRRMSAR